MEWISVCVCVCVYVCESVCLCELSMAYAPLWSEKAKKKCVCVAW